MRKETQEAILMDAKDDLSDKELISMGRYSLDMPRIWRREICPKDKKGTVSLRMSSSCWLGRQTQKSRHSQGVISAKKTSQNPTLVSCHKIDHSEHIMYYIYHTVLESLYPSYNGL